MAGILVAGWDEREGGQVGCVISMLSDVAGLHCASWWNVSAAAFYNGWFVSMCFVRPHS